jgi:hypothetical protein
LTVDGRENYHVFAARRLILHEQFIREYQGGSMAIYIGIEDAQDIAAFGSHAVAENMIRLVTELVRLGETVIFENRPVNKPPSIAFTLAHEKEVERWASDLSARLSEKR